MPFPSVLTSVDEVRELYRQPSKVAAGKVIDHVDETSASFIARSPFHLLATSHADGRCDVSPRGGPVGFVKVLDEKRVIVPDLNGNNLLDSLQNVIDNPQAGLLFLVPGRDETLRVNGRAWLTTDDAILDLFVDELRRPKLAVAVAVDEVYLHCAKSFRRGGVWSPETWSPDEAPTGGELITGQLGLEQTAAEMEGYLEESYAVGLAEDSPV
ncbi:MAG: pyridoxamine 5'-phosphate oxidase family protein [Actinomycetia bacterium]|nr:pyridoxamine 5'-phosphate oxidase family protein [Actinomycetes bacterium]MCP4087683.1 pyridoxamine 5'-phosphate oxidase family protein [Actinomycetes bacterium]